MIIQFKIHTTPHLLTADVTAEDVAKMLNTGMLGEQRLHSVLLHPFQEEESEACLWYMFDQAKAGLPGFSAIASDGE